MLTATYALANRPQRLTEAPRALSENVYNPLVQG